MAKVKNIFIFSLIILFFLPIGTDAGRKSSEPAAHKVTTESNDMVDIGAVFDPDTNDGAIAEISINLAISDFYTLHPNYKTRLNVHFTTAKDLVGTVAAAAELLNKFQVHAIIGPHASAAAPFLVELGQKSQVPIVSFFEISPTLSTTKNPYFIRVAQDDSAQVKAISAVLRKFSWPKVVLVYEDTDYSTGFISHLVDELQENEIQVPHMSLIPTSAEDFQISKELRKLRAMHTRVFIVHMKAALASRLFVLADKNGMMSKGYAWLITAALSNSLNVLNSEVNESMEGVLGVKPHVPKSKELEMFDKRWKSKLHSMKPNSSVTEINISGLWAYDTICALARAVEKIIWPPTNPSPNPSLGTSKIGPNLYNQILKTKFKGLSGEFNLINGQLESTVFEIVNVIGTGRVVGYWTPEKGLSQNLDSSGKQAYSPTSQNKLKQIIWLGDSTVTPRGWDIPNLRVGTPVKLGFPEFLEIHKDNDLNKTIYSGFSIDIFNAVLETLEEQLGIKVQSDFIPYEDKNGEMAGTYDNLLQQIKLKKYDAVVGDTTIVASRADYVQFTLPYTESGVTMLVPVKKNNLQNTWIFLKPWRWDLWLTAGLACIFIAIVIRIMERRSDNDDFKGSPIRQLGMILRLPFYAFVLPEKDLVKRQSSRFVLVVFLWLAFILMQSYTASLSSILTVDQLEPAIDNLDKLRLKGHYVGYQNDSFVADFLVKRLNFSRNQIRPYVDTKEYNEALSKGSKNGGVSAILEEIPYIRVFLKQYSSKYTTAGPIYRTDGFGFAFPIDSPLVSYFSHAILLVTENATRMDQIESKYFGERFVSPTLSPLMSTGSPRLNSYNFGGLFIIAGVAIILALIVSESHIWKKPLEIVIRRHFTSQQEPPPPPIENELVVVAPPNVVHVADAAGESVNSGHVNGIIITSAEENEAENPGDTSASQAEAENAMQP